MISKYRVIRWLGAGGMGEVLLAQDTQLERSVALKVMSAELARDANQRKRFRTEAKAASALVHPHISVIHEVGETEDGRPFLAMEYIAGQTLDALHQQRRPKISEVISIGIEVAEALQAAHAHGIVHRDIKPSNIMLDSRGHVKVLDFGLAKNVGRDELGASTTSAAQTRTGFLIGTPYYMSPEQMLGRELDARTDIFSLGVVLYELLAGQRPFLGKTVGEVINNVVNQQPESLGLENQLFSPALDGVIFKCLEKDPEKRYLSAKTLAEDLIRLRTESERAAIAKKESPPPTALAAAPPEVSTTKSQPALRPPGRRFDWGTALGGMAAAALLLLAGGAVFLHLHQGGKRDPSASRAPDSAPVPQKSVAVLPFDNFSGEPDTDYLSDGLTEEITTTLSRVPGLKVAARNSSFTFKGKKEDVRKVGQVLRVATLLEGSIRKVGSQIRVSAQLINAADGFHLWSETYDRSVNDIIGVQEEIARRIAERLQGGTASAPAAPRPAVDPEAHKLYLQARLFWNKRTAEGLKKAIELYHLSIEKEPAYAAAHAGLAASYLLLPVYSESSARPSEYMPLARAAANRALELDPACAEAHAVLGCQQRFARNRKEAEEHYRRAIQLDPNYATAHHWYGQLLELTGRRDEGLAELQKALDLDPLSPVIHATIPEWYYYGRNYDRAILEARKVVETFPDFPPARSVLIAPMMKKGMFKEALAEIEEARKLQPDQPLAMLDMKGFVLARLGQEAEARKVLAQLEQQRAQGRPVELAMASVYAGLREYDKMIELCEQVRATEGLDDTICVEPVMDEVRDLPQFQALLARAGLTNAPAP